MNNEWLLCKNILCIRPDNMGDLIMSTPAFEALKNTFRCKLTLLTSSMAAPVSPFIHCIDEVIVFDLPWIKKEKGSGSSSIATIAEIIREKRFDGAIIFTVYSQNPLPSAMIAWMANIPLRLAYCRENPYELLTHWVPDKEPYEFIQHQVKRDLELVKSIGAGIDDDALKISVNESSWPGLQRKILSFGIHESDTWLVMHTAVSESKRKYPAEEWIKIAKLAAIKNCCKIILTGSSKDEDDIEQLAGEMGEHAYPLAGKLSIEEFILLIKNAPLLVTVNTVAMHIAAATGTPVIALYAMSNPQHYPWRAKGKVFKYAIPENMQSKNEVIRFASRQYHPYALPVISVADIVRECTRILQHKNAAAIPEMEILETAGTATVF